MAVAVVAGSIHWVAADTSEEVYEAQELILVQGAQDYDLTEGIVYDPALYELEVLDTGDFDINVPGAYEVTYSLTPVTETPADEDKAVDVDNPDASAPGTDGADQDKTDQDKADQDGETADQPGTGNDGDRAPGTDNGTGDATGEDTADQPGTDSSGDPAAGADNGNANSGATTGADSSDAAPSGSDSGNSDTTTDSEPAAAESDASADTTTGDADAGQSNSGSDAAAQAVSAQSDAAGDAAVQSVEQTMDEQTAIKTVNERVIVQAGKSQAKAKAEPQPEVVEEQLPMVAADGETSDAVVTSETGAAEAVEEAAAQNTGSDANAAIDTNTNTETVVTNAADAAESVQTTANSAEAAQQVVSQTVITFSRTVYVIDPAEMYSVASYAETGGGDYTGDYIVDLHAPLWENDEHKKFQFPFATVTSKTGKGIYALTVHFSKDEGDVITTEQGDSRVDAAGGNGFTLFYTTPKDPEYIQDVIRNMVFKPYHNVNMDIVFVVSGNKTEENFLLWRCVQH